MNPTQITNKEIQYNIMIALMQIAGNLSDMVTNTTEFDCLTGGEIDELTRPSE